MFYDVTNIELEIKFDLRLDTNFLFDPDTRVLLIYTSSRATLQTIILRLDVFRPNGEIAQSIWYTVEIGLEDESNAFDPNAINGEFNSNQDIPCLDSDQAHNWKFNFDSDLVSSSNYEYADDDS